MLAKPSSAALIVFVVSIALYANTLNHDFVWDDHILIEENPGVRTFDLSTIEAIFTNDFWDAGGSGGSYYRPLVTLSYLVDYRLFNGQPAGFHFTNVFWNAAACAMVFVFVYLLFGNPLTGLATAFLFAAHPVHTEAVAWISGRTDIFATFWSLVALSTYVLARRRHSYLMLLGALTAFLFALLSKESAACVPLLVVLLEISPMSKVIVPRNAVTSRANSPVLYTASFFGVFVLYAVLRFQVVGTVTSNYEAYAPEALGYLAVPLSIFVGYVHKILFPFKLSAEYDPPVPSSFANSHVLFGIILLAFLVWIVWRFRSRPLPVFGVGLFAIGIAPVLNVIPIGELSAERFLYFPSLGAALIFGNIFAAALTTRHASLRRNRAKTAGALPMSPTVAGTLQVFFGIVLIVFTVMTVTRNTVWKNDYALFSKTIEQEPGNPRAHALFGAAAMERGDIEVAVRACEKALSLDPGNSKSLNLLAGIYVQQGRFNDALPLVEQALAASPDDPQLISNLGSIYLETKQYAKAAQQFEKALVFNPHQLRTHFNLGLTHVEQGEPEQAREYFERALQGGPAFNMANYHLSMIEFAAGDSAQAKEYAKQFLALHHQNDSFRRRAEAILRGDVTPSPP